MSESPFFLEALLVILRDFYLRFGVAEIKADVEGCKGRDRIEKISIWMAKLKRDEQVEKFRDAAS